jgi:hypothetical protein
LDPDALVGYRRSLAAGFKYNKKLRRFDKPFNPQDFDVDAFIVSDKLARQIGWTRDWRSGEKITAIQELQEKTERLMRVHPEFQGMRSDKKFTFRVFTKQEWKRYARTPFKLFTK